MTATINLNSAISSDIRDFAKPFAESLGILDEDDNLDLANWDADKAASIFESYERVSALLEVVGIVLGSPQKRYRQKEYTDSNGITKPSGLVFDTTDDSNKTVEELWYEFFDTQNGITLHFTVTLLDKVQYSSELISCDVRIGLGIRWEQDGKKIEASIPIIRIYDDKTNAAEPTVKTEELLWGSDVNEPWINCTSISASLSDPGDRIYTVPSGPSVSALSLRLSLSDHGELFVAVLEDYRKNDSLTGSNIVIDSWDDVAEVGLEVALNSLLSSVTQPWVSNYLLPMIGLMNPTDPNYKNWPMLDVGALFNIVMGNSNNADAGTVFLDWISELIDEQGISDSTTPKNKARKHLDYWFDLLSGLIHNKDDMRDKDERGSGTLNDPYKVSLASILSAVDINLLGATEKDSDGNTWLHVGFSTLVKKTWPPNFPTNLAASGHLDVWLAKIRISSDPTVSFLPGMDILFDIERNDANGKIDLISAVGDTESINLNNHNGIPTDVDLSIGFLRTGLRWHDGVFDPVVEIHDAQIGTQPVECMDLADADAPAQMLDVLATNLLDVLRSFFVEKAVDDATGNVSIKDTPNRWLGTLLGLVPPRNTVLMTDRNEAEPFMYDSANPSTRSDMRKGWMVIDHALTEGPSGVITSPLAAIAEYHRLHANNGTWVHILYALGNLMGHALQDEPAVSAPVAIPASPYIPTWFEKSSTETWPDAYTRIHAQKRWEFTLHGEHRYLPKLTLGASKGTSPDSLSVDLEVRFVEEVLLQRIPFWFGLHGNLFDVDFGQNEGDVTDSAMLSKQGIRLRLDGMEQYIPDPKLKDLSLWADALPDMQTGTPEFAALKDWEFIPWENGLRHVSGNGGAVHSLMLKEDMGLITGEKYHFEMRVKIDPNSTGKISFDGSTDPLGSIEPNDKRLNTKGKGRIRTTFIAPPQGTSIQINCDEKLDVDIERISVWKESDIEIGPLVDMTLKLNSALAEIYLERGTGLKWDFSINDVEFDWGAPTLRNISDAGLANVYWNGKELITAPGFVWDSTAKTLTHPEDENGNKFVETINFNPIGLGWDMVRFDSSGHHFIHNGNELSAAALEADLTDVARAFVGQFLLYRCGQLGFFLAGFFHIHPSFPLIEIYSHLGKNGLRLSHQNVANPLNKKPDSWRRSHNQIWGMTGLGPYTLPLDWPELDIGLLTNDPIACLKDHFIEIFSGTSSAGGPHALHSINLIHGLISGGLPDLRRADLGWVVFDGVVYPTASPLSIRGGGSRANPYKVPLTSNSSAKAELLLWTDANSLRTALLEDYSLLPLLDVYGSDWRGDPNFMNRSMPEGPASKWSLLVEAVFRTAESCEELAEVIIDWDGDSMVRAFEALDGFVKNHESISFLDIKSHNDSGKFQHEADVLIPYSKGMDLIDWTVVDGIFSLSGSMAATQVILVAENSERGDWASIISGIRTQLQIPMADTVNGEDFTFLVEDPVGTNLSRQIRWLDYSVIRGEQYSAGKSVADWLNSLLGQCIHDHQSLTGGSTMPQILIVAEKSACREIVATSAEIIDSGGSCEIAEIIALPTINPLSHSSSLTSDYLELVREGAHLLKRIGTLTGAQAISPRLLAVSDFVIGISQMEVVR